MDSTTDVAAVGNDPDALHAFYREHLRPADPARWGTRRVDAALRDTIIREVFSASPNVTSR